MNHRLMIAVAAVAALAAACGSSGGSKSAPSTKAAAPAAPAAPKSSAPPPAPATTISLRSSKFGKILVDAKGDTLYLFEKDGMNKSACSGACATAWPPVTTTGSPMSGTGLTASMLGTIKRADGSTQVTYAGHPLYTFVKDTAAGDTTGEDVNNFGAGWYVLGGDGKKIEPKSSTGSSSNDNSGSNYGNNNSGNDNSGSNNTGGNGGW